jgi:P pilus assembly chaperone PapD
MNKNYIVLFVFLLASIVAYSQNVSVSPSRFYFNVSPGNYKSQKLRVTNNGTKPQTFTVNFVNFGSSGNKGKTQIDTNRTSAHGMADWLSASPSFFELGAGESKEVDILLQLPNIPEANSVRWALASVKISKENTGPTEKGENVTGMAIVSTFSFLIHLFQTPPSVTYTEVIVEKFYEDTINSNDSIRVLVMDTKNIGDAIANCVPYLDMVNLKNGEKRQVKTKGYTILPGGVRQIKFIIPSDLSKGEYNILGIVDYGSETDIAAMELNIKIE